MKDKILLVLITSLLISPLRLIFPSVATSSIIFTIVYLIGFLLVDYYFKFNFKIIHYIFFIIINILGSIASPLYFTYSYYDKFLHLTMPFLACFLVFHATSKLKASINLRILITLLAVFSMGAFLEIIEYILDTVFGLLYFQGVFLSGFGWVQSKIDDTMTDLILDLAGVSIFSIIYLIKYNKKK